MQSMRWSIRFQSELKKRSSISNRNGELPGLYKYTMIYILYTLYLYRVRILRVFPNISSSKPNIPSIFIGCRNLRRFRVISFSFSIPANIREYPQISALYKNRGYISYSRSYNPKYHQIPVRYKNARHIRYRGS